MMNVLNNRSMIRIYNSNLFRFLVSVIDTCTAGHQNKNCLRIRGNLAPKFHWRHPQELYSRSWIQFSWHCQVGRWTSHWHEYIFRYFTFLYNARYFTHALHVGFLKYECWKSHTLGQTRLLHPSSLRQALHRWASKTNNGPPLLLWVLQLLIERGAHSWRPWNARSCRLDQNGFGKFFIHLTFF